MLKRSSQIRYEVERAVDLAIATLALTFAVALRREVTAWFPGLVPIFDFWPEAGWLYVMVVIAWGVLLDVFGLYDRRAIKSPVRYFMALLKVNVAGVFLAFALFYLLKVKHIPRLLILLFALFDLLFMTLKALFVRNMETRYAGRPNILFAGHPEDFEGMLERFVDLPGWQPNIVGILSPGTGAPPRGLTLHGREAGPALGTIRDLVHILHTRAVDYVVLHPSHERFDEIQNVISTCETEGVETWMLAEFFRTRIARATLDEFEGLPMITFSTTPGISWALLAKRVVDLVGGLLLTALALPFMLVIALAVKMTSPGPILFVQERCTLHGRVFRMFKFRTMIVGAEDSLRHLEEKNEMSGPVFKMSEDPRVTPVGRFLRKYSLDELPQLFNVVRGDMSIVGPRPPIPSEVAKYENWQRRRLSMRSGITGLWQVSGRNRVGFDEWMRLDLKYIDEWSLMLDFQIIARTVWAVLRGSGV